MGCVIGISLILLGPTISGLLWRASHAHSVSFDGYQIAVPFPFLLRAQRDGMQLLRLRPAWAWPFYRGESILITRNQRHNNVERWRADAESAVEGQGSTGVNAFDLQFAGSPVRCIQTAQHGGQVQTSIVCVNNGDLILQYFGDDRGVSGFRQFLNNGIRPANP